MNLLKKIQYLTGNALVFLLGFAVGASLIGWSWIATEVEYSRHPPTFIYRGVVPTVVLYQSQRQGCSIVTSGDNGPAVTGY